MESYDILSALEDRGIKPDIANQIVNHVKGNDYINLISALQDNDQEELDNIISKFGVISESKLKYLDHSTENQALILDGYKYCFEVSFKECDSIMDWLEEHNIEYLTNGVGEFDIKCDDTQAKEIIEMLSNKENKMIESKLVPMGRLDPNIVRLRELAGFNDTVTPVPDDSEDDSEIITTIPDTDDVDMGTPELDTGNSIDDVTDTVVPEQCSPAMNEINDYLNNIQNKIPDITLSEYKTLVIKLQDLTGQIQSMAKGYLGERKLRK